MKKKCITTIYNKELESEEVRKSYKDIIRCNVTQSIISLVKAADTLNIPLKDRTDAIELLRQFSDDVQLLQISKEFSEKTGEMLNRVWMDEGIQKVYERRNEFQIQRNIGRYYNISKNVYF